MASFLSAPSLAHVGPSTVKIAPQSCTVRPRSWTMVRVSHDVSHPLVAGEAIAPEKEFSYEPSVWGDFFINYKPQPLQKSEEGMRHRANKLKENVRRLFWTSNDVVARMNLVDSIQHLGIGHLFDDEISHTLNDIYQSEFTSSSLHEVALRFRLLREHGLWVSPDVFNKFKGDDGRFINKLASEPRGLLSLYNAAYLLIHDEPELEEAISFSRYHLKSMMQGSDVKQPLVNQISRALHLPLPRTYKRVETLHYLSEDGQEEGHIPILLDLAKLDFNLLQRVHLKELKAISEWSKDLYRYMGLSYIRERVVEAYTWSYMMYYEEDFALTRMFVAKLIALGTVMDDTYDAHATIQECRLLNTAIQRWDDSAISILPEYLKKFYHKLLINFKEFEDQVAANEKYRVAYTKQEFQKQSAYYLQGAEWSNEKHKPSFQDQVVLSTKSSAVQLVCVAAAVGWGDAMTAEAFEWASSGNATVVACAKIGRFLNDIAAFKRGKNRGDVASSVECYINENGVTSDVAFAKIDLLIEDEWRTMNLNRFEHQEMLPIVQRVVIFAVSLVLFYDGRMDAYTFAPLLTEVIKSLFVRPIPIS